MATSKKQTTAGKKQDKNLKAKKALQISMINHLIKKIKKSLNKFKVNFNVIYLIINY